MPLFKKMPVFSAIYPFSVSVDGFAPVLRKMPDFNNKSKNGGARSW